MVDVPVRFLLQSQAARRDIAQLTQAVRALRRETQQTSDGLKDTADNTRTASNEFTQLGGLVRNARTGFVGLIGALGIREIIQLADSWQLANNRLNALIGSERVATQIQAELVDVANETRVGFTGTADVFARLALNADELGVSNRRLIGITRTLNQAVVVSGASAEESRNAIIQLSQGIASGALRGDELRSVLEQLPIVARLISRELGVTTGQLRELGAEGAITSEIVLSAFENNADEIAEAFARTEVTVGQALTVLGNTVIEFVGRADQATEASGFLAGAIQTVAEIIDTQARISFPSLSDEIARLEEELQRANTPFLELAQQGLPQASTSAEILEERLAALRAQLELETESIAEADRRLRQLETTRRQEAAARRVQSDAGQELIDNLDFELGLINASNSERQAAILIRRAGNEVTTEEIAQIRELTLQIDLETEAIKRRAEAQREAEREQRRADREAARERAERQSEAIEEGRRIQEEEDRRLSARTPNGSEEGSRLIAERERETFELLEEIRREQDQTELDRIREREEQKLRIIDEARARGLITEQEASRRSLNIQLQSVGDRVSVIRGFTEQLATTFEDVEGLGKAFFVANKAVAIAEATINTATAVTKALASSPPPLNFVLAGVTAAFGALQIASIVATTVQGLQRGGEVQHMAGGGTVPGSGTGDTVPARLEPGEIVINKRAASRFRPQLLALNKQVPRFQTGGEVGGFLNDSPTSSFANGRGGVTVVQIDAKGADIGTVQRLEQVIAEQQRQIDELPEQIRTERQDDPSFFRPS